MSLRLKPKARLVRRARTGSTLLVYPERALELNASAVEIVELLDGTRSAADVADVMVRRHPDRTPEIVRAGVERFLGELSNRALLDA